MTNKKSEPRHTAVKLELPLNKEPDFQDKVEEFLTGLRVEQSLIKLRKEQGLTQSQLANILGVTQPFIAKMESGQLTNIELRTLARAVFALNGTLEIRIKPRGASRDNARAAFAQANSNK